MFTIDDDFEVDEDFLESAFSIEACETKTNTNSKNFIQHPECSSKSYSDVISAQPGISRPTENEAVKNSEFLDLWKKNDENLFFSKSPTKLPNPKNLLDIVRAISPTGVRSEVVTRTSKHVRQRKFPGPAGLLPERTCNTSFIAAEEYLSKIEDEEEKNPNFEDKEVLSQASNKFFEEPGSAWKTMMEDLGPHGIHLINNINLASVRVKQARFGFKVPFLAVCVHNIDCSLPDPSLLLKDKIDEMHGTLHREVWEEWKDDIVVGSVLVLRNIGVISAGNSSRRFFLNITANNIGTIYSPKLDTSLKVTKIQPCGMNTDEILEEWERVMNQTRQQQLGTESPQMKPLYGSALGMASPVLPQGMSPLQNTPSPASTSSNRHFTPPVKPSFKPRAPVSQQNFQKQQAPRPQRPLAPHNPRNIPLPGRQGFQRPQTPSGQMNASPRLSFSNPHPANSRAPAFSSPTPNGIVRNVPRQSVQSGIPFSNSNAKSEPLDKNLTVETPAPLKKPRISNDNENTKPSSVFTVSSSANQAILDSLLDGIDTDSLFDDF